VNRGIVGRIVLLLVANSFNFKSSICGGDTCLGNNGAYPWKTEYQCITIRDIHPITA
jgi:hypothetical protein